MSEKLRELLQEKAKLTADMRAALDAAEKRGGLTAEDREKREKFFADINKVKDQIKDEEANIEVRRLEAEAAGAHRPAPAGKPGEARRFKFDTDEFRAKFRGFLTGEAGAPEVRALQADLDVSGGYAVVPETISSAMIQAKDNLVHVRRLATKYTVTNADSLGVVSLDTDPAAPAWTPEIGSLSEDSSMALGKRALTPHQLTKLLKVSDKLLRVSMFNMEALVGQRLGYQFAVTEENIFLNGTGAQQPLGVFTASNDGITTSQDVSTGNTTTSITYDGLKACKYNLPAQYRNSAGCGWIFHRDAVSQIAQLKDGNQRYLWQDSVVLGEPDRLLGFPVYESEYAPNTFTAGLYVGILGDFSYYSIVDALNVRIKRLNELFAGNSQVGFVAQQEVDGMPVLAAAFRRVKLAAS